MMNATPVAPAHGAVDRTALLLINLGTPAAPEPGAVRRYLREFLSDPRVVEIPRVVWWPILHGVILRTRPRSSARKYASVWTEKGSPLLANSQQQAILLRGYLGDRGLDLDVALAMRYGDPSVASVLRDLQQRRVRRVLILPMYPQYSAATTASALDAVFDELKSIRNLPEVRWVRSFHDDPGYIGALRQSVLDHWRRNGAAPLQGGRLVISFHGVPRRTLDLGDPYHCECQTTARLLAASLGLSAKQYLVTFQSRFGRAEWLQPYTAPTLIQLARDGVKRVDVVCPGFAVDCLETLEEIAIEARADFLAAGGTEFGYIPCLNDAPAFMRALSDIATRHMHGWPIERSLSEAREQEAQERRARARSLGASD